MVIVEPGDPRTPQASALLLSSHALMQELFPADDIYALDIDDLCTPDMRFFVAREGETILGTGALALRRDYGEVKSMFTAPAARGKGVAAALLRQIEDTARAENLAMLRLETGEELASAIRLYERHGFARCGIFGDYQPNTTSVYMEKPIQPAP